MTFAYPYQNGLYLNLTNRCPTSCAFCIKRRWRWEYRGWDLNLGRIEPSADQVWRAIESQASQRTFDEFVFCGYGESTYRLPVMLDISRKARKQWPMTTLRLNTIGLGSLICGRDIVPDISRVLDAVSVSLNTADPIQWIALHGPRAPFRRQGFGSTLKFIAGCVKAKLETTITAVEQPGVDLDAVSRVARTLGAGFRIRPSL